VGSREVINATPRSAGSTGVQKAQGVFLKKKAQGVLQGFAFPMAVVRGAKSQAATKVARAEQQTVAPR
jgi:hypothetical protein